MSPRLSIYQSKDTLNKATLVADQATDHQLVKAKIKTTHGTTLSIFSLNLLMRKSISFSLIQGKVSVILNFPIQWFNDNHCIYLVNEQLIQYKKFLKLMGDRTSPKTLQLAMLDRDTNLPSTSLPVNEKNQLVTHISLETDLCFYKRLFSLGLFVGQTMYSASQKGEEPIFAVQELQNHPEAFSNFMNGVRQANNWCSNIMSDSEVNHHYHQPAILFNNQILEALPIDNNFKSELAAIIQGQSKSDIGQCHAIALRIRENDYIIKIASIHINFSVINQHICDAEYNIMQDLEVLATQHNIILAGDFNKKIESVDEIECLTKKSIAANKASAFKSTPPNLQLHDTIDGILLPSDLYACFKLEYNHKASLNLS